MIKYLCFLTFFIIISCSNSLDEKLLSKEILVEILIDMHVLEVAIDNLNLSKDSSRVFYNQQEEEIFKKYNIDDKMYRESFSYYFFEPKELDQIYQHVIDSLLLYQQTK
jgi:hypothetical protein|tara:strand:+ start:449 stop:775 length:327 start_codon:yes stop_codon:yes gene_type:complete